MTLLGGIFMAQNYLIAHDIGTSGNKASLFTTDGNLIQSKTVHYKTHYGPGHVAEQNPADWWDAIVKSTQSILSGISTENVLAMSFSAQMQGCVLVDSKGDVLRPAIIWADHRALEETNTLIDKVGFDKIFSITGHRPSPSYSLEKLMWVMKHEPHIYKKTAFMLQAKDYIIHQLTGVFLTDASDASGTNAYDLKAQSWSTELIDAAGVHQRLFPPIYKSTDIAGHLTSQAAQQLGLSENIKVVVGGGDGPCSALGAGCIESDSLFLTFGTSAWIGGTTNTVFIDPKQRLFCFSHVIPGKYMPCGTMQSAGSAYNYIKTLFYEYESIRAKEQGINPYDALDRLIKTSPAGSNGLFFLPYLTGERSPHWNPNASASFIGMAMHQNKADYLRSVIEGIAYNLRLILNAYQPQLSVEHMVFTGGGAKSDCISQILSDVLSVELTRPAQVENATSIAAAILAGVGIGIYDDFNIINTFLPLKERFNPISENSRLYNQRIKAFQNIYDALLPIYDELNTYITH